MAIKPDRFSLLAGRRYGRAEFQKRGLGKRGHETWPKLAQKFPSVSLFCQESMSGRVRVRVVYSIEEEILILV